MTWRQETELNRRERWALRDGDGMSVAYVEQVEAGWRWSLTEFPAGGVVRSRSAAFREANAAARAR